MLASPAQSQPGTPAHSCFLGRSQGDTVRRVGMDEAHEHYCFPSLVLPEGSVKVIEQI